MASDDYDAGSAKASIENPIEMVLRRGAPGDDGPSIRGVASSLPWGALAAALIVSLRVWSVAHLNLSVALQLLTLTDASKVLLGLAVVTLPSIMIFVALYVHAVCTEILTGAIKSARSKEPVHFPNRSLLFFLLWAPVVAVAIAFVSLVSGALIVAGGLLLTIQRLVVGSRPKPRAEEPAPHPEVGSKPKPKAEEPAPHPEMTFRYRVTLIMVGLALIGFGFTLTCFDDTPWLPPDQITLTNGAVVVGYVAAESSSEFTVLLNSDRNIIDIPATEVKRQELCQFGNSGAVAQLFWGRRNPTVPTCA